MKLRRQHVEEMIHVQVKVMGGKGVKTNYQSQFSIKISILGHFIVLTKYLESN